MESMVRTLSPSDGRVVVERPFASAAEQAACLSQARAAQAKWQQTPLATRQEILTRAVDRMVAQKEEIAAEITMQMGRPIAQSPGEVNGFEERARHLISIADSALAKVDPGPKTGFERWIERAPLGVVVVIAPWNFPYLTSVNAVWTALLAGNAVVLKHSPQTPLCAERYQQVLQEAGLPEGVFQYLHLDLDGTTALVQDPQVDFVAFTGSVEGGHAVTQALAQSFKGCGLELGGKDPAYVRADADLTQAVETLVDGACFNSGQSCCGIERIYVHESLFDAFVEQAAALMASYRLGDPQDPETNLGPLVNPHAADKVRSHVQEALEQGATAHVDPALFPVAQPGTSYCAPQLLTNVTHEMTLMREETFGPVVGVMKVQDDEEALALMNDSRYGLTAALFTRDVAVAEQLAARLETGTVFMNRCDYLDPALAWTGVKDSGRGCTLSAVGFEHFTRPKSYHFRLPTS